MNPQKILVLQGLPASGKSTWAKEFITKNPGWKRINKDDLRRMIDAGQWSKGNEKFILHLHDIIISGALRRKYSVIVDDTNFEPAHIERVRTLAKMYKGVAVDVRLFNVDPTECIKRNALRAEFERVPDKVIWDMYNRYIRPHEYVDQSPASQDPSLRHIVLCDLDGTLAIMGDRSPYDCMKSGADEVNWPVLSIVQAYMNNSKDNHVVFFSGRNEACRGVTEEWLEKLGFYEPLFMRADGDNRKDSEVKLEMYNRHVRDKYYVDFVLDDRDQVVEMWRRTLNLTCLQVNYGDF